MREASSSSSSTAISCALQASCHLFGVPVCCSCGVCSDGSGEREGASGAATQNRASVAARAPEGTRRRVQDHVGCRFYCTQPAGSAGSGGHRATCW